MSFVTRAKDKLKKEYEAVQYNRQLKNNPQVVKQKLEYARAEQKEAQTRVKENIQFEKDKAELQNLQRGNNKFGAMLSGVKSHLDNVKQKNNTQVKTRFNKTNVSTGRNIIYDESPTRNSAFTLNNQPTGAKSLIMSETRNPNQSVFGHSGGVLGTQPQAKKQKKKTTSKTIVIKL